jgi:hypothetical protein
MDPAKGVGKPGPVLNPQPKPFFKADTGDASGKVITGPSRENENDFPLETFRNFTLVIQKMPAVILSEIGVQFLGTLHYNQVEKN